MALRTLDGQQLLGLSAAVAALGVLAVYGSARIEAWAEPVDFVQVCSNEPGTTSKATDGFEVRVAALDSMIVCTEQMEVVYVGMAKTASGVSLALYLLLTAAGATLMVFARRWYGSRSTSSDEGGN
jgi:hypothetical protein